MANAEQVKVNFPFDFGAESMWADVLDLGHFRLDNIPLFAYGISYGDEFTANPIEGILTFDKVVRRAGDWTYRASLNEGIADISEANDLLSKVAGLAKLTSQYGSEQRAFSVESSQKDNIEALLDEGKRKGFWDWEISSAPVDELDQ